VQPSDETIEQVDHVPFLLRDSSFGLHSRPW
jgi:hypothetical protein